ncbi:MAG: hypothetical protein ACLFTA_01130 [Candidatus Nanohaloarchaea archaeon]
MVDWGDVRDGLTYPFRAIKTDSERLYGGTKDVWNNGGAADPDPTRRDVIKAAGLAIGGPVVWDAADGNDKVGAAGSAGLDGISWAADNSPVGLRNPITFGDEEEVADQDPAYKEEVEMDLDEFCSSYLEAEGPARQNFEQYLEMIERNEGSLEGLSVEGGVYLDHEESRYANIQITGEYDDQDEIGLSREVAEALSEAYEEDREAFYDAMDEVLEDGCKR